MKYFQCTISVLIFFFAFQFASAQKYAYQKAQVYLLKSDFTVTKDAKQADYLLQIIKYSDSSYVCRYYNKFGPMLKQESFLDSSLSIPNGIFAWYDMTGNIDSLAYVYGGRKSEWISYDDSLKTTLFVRYKDGNLFEKRDYLLNIYTDSTGQTGNLTEKEQQERDKYTRDSFAKNQKEANFQGGSKKWNKYLNGHLVVPDRFEKSMPDGIYNVIVSFLITTEGKVDEILLMHSCEWSADLEVFKIFENSPPWQPATQNGKNVKYRQRQNITFEVHH
jgi:protein TonB